MSYPPNYDGNIHGPQDFYDVLSEYIEQLQPVTKAVKEICTAALGSAKGIDLPTSHLQDLEVGSTGLLRASRSPSTPGFDDATKLMPHSDFGSKSLTVLIVLSLHSNTHNTFYFSCHNYFR